MDARPSQRNRNACGEQLRAQIQTFQGTPFGLVRVALGSASLELLEGRASISLQGVKVDLPKNDVPRRCPSERLERVRLSLNHILAGKYISPLVAEIALKYYALFLSDTFTRVDESSTITIDVRLRMSRPVNY